MNSNLRIGIIGFDTSHVPAFTKLLSDPADPNHIPGATVVAGFPSFSPDLASSASRVQEYTDAVEGPYGVQIVKSIDELLPLVDVVLLESVDGRRHLAEATAVIKARKPVFIDKPLAHNYADAAAIVRLAKENECPVFSSSSLRFDVNMLAIKNDPELGDVISCDAFSPASLDPSNPGLFWYGVHGVEILYTFMGTGCRELRAFHQEGCDVVVGTWGDGRIGTMRGTRAGAHDYGASVFGSKKVAQATFSREVPIYAQLMRQVVPFLQGGPAPVSLDETLEMMAFMQAAIISEQENRAVQLSELS